MTWNKKTIAEWPVLGGNGAKLIGSPATVADELERWVEFVDIDGFNLSYASLPETFQDIIKLLVPELRRRDVFWDDHAVPGGTVRENYFGKPGGNQLADNHPGAQYFWKVDEPEPESPN